MTSNWIRFTKKDCPICAGQRKDCRQSTQTNLIHCRDLGATPPGWTFIKEDSLGFGIWAEQAALDSRNEQRREEWRTEQQQRQKQKQERALKLLPLEQRDKQYRQLPSLAQRYLNEKHRSKLRYRGLRQEEIDFAVSQGWLHTWQPAMPVFGLSPDLAGVKLKNGKPTLTGVPGIAIAANNFDGKIAGFQIGADEREKFGKYIWLSSANQGGNGPNLPSGELPLFFWQHPEADRIRYIWFVEGGLKSLITALCLWFRHDLKDIAVFGTPSSGNFEIGKSQVEEVIERLGSNLLGVSFCPDAGAISNPNLVGPNGGYRKTFALLKELGCNLKIKWWNQRSKKRGHYNNKLDIDEIQAEGKAEIIRDISLDEFLSYIPSEIAQNQRQTQRKNGLIDREAWLQIKSFDDFKSLFKAVTERFKPQEEKQQSKPEECLALVPYRGVASLNLASPNDVPSPEEWLAMGKPKFYFNEGERINFYIAAKEKGYLAVVDRSGVGMGKSYDSGNLQRAHFDLQEFDAKTKTDIGGRIFYFASDYKNPTTESVERNFTEFIHRHDGETLDPNRRTPLGKPYRRNTPDGKNPDIPGNCPESMTFLMASEQKDAMIFGGKDSPICTRCPHFDGCSFLETRTAQLRAKYNLRAHIDSVGALSEKDVALVDEPGALLKSCKSIEVSLKEIESLSFKLQQKDPELYSLVAAPLSMIWSKLSGLKDIPRNGFSMTETLAILAGGADEQTVNIWKRYRELGEAFEHPVVSEMRAKLEEAYPDSDPWEAPGISDLEAQIAKAMANKWDEIFEGCQFPEQKQQAIQDKAALNWLSPFLKAITGSDRTINIAITEAGKLKITRRSLRHKRTLQSAGFTILLDATASIQDLKQKTGFKNILEIEQKQADNACQNLRIRVVRGLGTNPKGTSDETTWKRYYAAIEALIQKQPGLSKEQRAIISFKKSVDRFSRFDAITGYWYGDTRGNNRFTQALQLTVHGLPKPNLADKAAEWQARTGQLVNPTDIRGSRYGNWYWGEVTAELIQCCGRLRAHLRPTEQMEINLMAGDALSDWDIGKLRQAFPGCEIEIVDAYDLAPAAASKGTQKARGMVEAIWATIQQTGDASRLAIAKILEITPGRVSQLAKEACGKTFSQLVDALVFLYKAIKGKTNATDLPDDLVWWAKEFLPQVALELEEAKKRNDAVGVEDAGDMAIEFCQNHSPAMVRRILAATEPWVLCKLLGGLMKVAVERLLDVSPPPPEPGAG